MDVRTNLPPRYRLRPPRADEASTIDRLSAACDAAFGGAPVLSEEMIRQRWSRPRFDLQSDAWVVELGPRIVAYAEVWDSDPARLSGFAMVHPEHLGLGIGGALAAVVQDRAAGKASGEARLFSAVLPGDAAAARLLGARGYEWTRRFWHMEIDLPGRSDRPAPPPGIELRRLDPERDLPAAHRILEEAFEDHWDHTPTAYEEFLDLNVRDDGFDPTLWIVAAHAGAPVGVLCGSAHPDRGWIDQLGVLRSHRGMGIATALLWESFAGFGRLGLTRVRLNVDSDNPTGAVSLYQRVGMRVVTSYDLWALTISSRSDGTPGSR